jgi:hypothetical protein
MLLNGAAGIARLLGYPVPTIPSSILDRAQSAVDRFQQASSVASFDCLQTALDSSAAEGSKGSGDTKTVRGKALRDLEAFYTQNGGQKIWDAVNLCRFSGKDGHACWATEEDMKKMQEKSNPLTSSTTAVAASIFTVSSNVQTESALSKAVSAKPVEVAVPSPSEARSLETVQTPAEYQQELELISAPRQNLTGNVSSLLKLRRAREEAASASEIVVDSEFDDVGYPIKFLESELRKKAEWLNTQQAWLEDRERWVRAYLKEKEDLFKEKEEMLQAKLRVLEEQNAALLEEKGKASKKGGGFTSWKTFNYSEGKR